MRIHHVALTVPDLDEAVRFYAETFGGSERYRLGPFDAEELPALPDGRDWTEAHVNVAGARLRIALVDIGGGPPLELFEYERPSGRDAPPRNHDRGGHHVAFKVDDIDAEADRLRDRGVRLLERIEIDDGPAAGQRVQYALDPWDNQLELIQWDH